jgi:foldase protein PrsA
MRTVSALGAFFVLAIVVAACGGSSGGSTKDAVATVAGNPISKTAFNHWMYVAEKGNAEQAQQQGSSVPVIVPTDPPNFTGCIAQVRAQIPTYAKTSASTLKADCGQLFQSLAGQVLDFLIKGYWYQATAYKDGIKVTQSQLDKAFAAAKKQSFPTAAEYTQFLQATGETKQDVYFRLRVNAVYAKLLAKYEPKTSQKAISAYYKAHSQEFGTPEQRNLLIIRTNSQSQIKAAQSALKSGQSWAAVAKKYSVDTATKANGGKLTGITNGEEETAVNKVAFSAPLNQVQAPIHGEFGWYLIEVTKITKGTQQSLAKATPEIKSILTQQNQTGAANKVNAAAKKQWGSQTNCAKAYNVVNDCKGYKKPAATTTTPAATATTSNQSVTVTPVPSTTGTQTGTATTSAPATVTTGASSGTSTTK